MDKLKKMVLEYKEYRNSDEYHEDNDYAHYIYEAAVEAVLGEDCWKEFKN